jgi:uncharacterized membrane protein
MKDSTIQAPKSPQATRDGGFSSASRFTAREVSPLFCIVGSSILAGVIGVIISVQLLSDFVKDDSLGFGALAAPFFFIVTFVGFFFYAWSPILGAALFACGIMPSLRRRASGLVWVCSCVAWIVSLVPFYFAVLFIRGSPVLAKYWPF